MEEKVSLTVRNPAVDMHPFTAQVKVTGAAPGSLVTVTLQQTRGIEPLNPAMEQQTRAGADGTAYVEFSVRLAGPALAVLLADASDDLGPHFTPDAEWLEVVA